MRPVNGISGLKSYYRAPTQFRETPPRCRRGEAVVRKRSFRQREDRHGSPDVGRGLSPQGGDARMRHISRAIDAYCLVLVIAIEHVLDGEERKRPSIARS